MRRDRSYRAASSRWRALLVLTTLVLVFCALGCKSDTAIPFGRTQQAENKGPPSPPAPPETLLPPDTPILPTDVDSAYLPGGGQVSADGAYTYNIPIHTPPGRAGMEPHLGLAYSSRAGDGLFGVGWTLSGTSSVHRCAKTFATDGRADDESALCLDNQRLLSTSPGEYRTELESFARIETYTTADGQSALRVYDKTGLIREYESFVAEPDLWPLARARDRAGNEIRYEYTLESHEIRLASINYTAQAGTSEPGTRRVDFAYIDRSFPLDAWRKGKELHQSKLLQTIRAYAPGSAAPQWEYTLNYQEAPGTRRPLLSSVSLCAQGTCTQAKEFSYGKPPQQRWIPWLPLSMGAQAPKPVVLDADGDGRDDLYFRDSDGHDHLLLSVALSTGFIPLQEHFVTDIPIINPPIPVDIDGDGQVELAGIKLVPPASFAWALYRWDGANFVEVPNALPSSLPAPHRLSFVDLDGNALPDLVTASQVWLNQGGSFAAPTPVAWDDPDFSNVRALDYFGDHRGGFMQLNYLHEGYYWQLDDQGNFSRATLDVQSPADAKILSADITGDGLPDTLSLLTGATQNLQINTGTVTPLQGATATFDVSLDIARSDENGNLWDDDFLVADINRDGRDDLIAFSSAQSVATHVHIHQNLPGGAFESQDLGLTPSNADRIQSVRTGDFDGDGRVDLLVLTPDANYTESIARVFTQADETEDLLVEVHELGNPSSSEEIRLRALEPTGRANQYLRVSPALHAARLARCGPSSRCLQSFPERPRLEHIYLRRPALGPLGPRFPRLWQSACLVCRASDRGHDRIPQRRPGSDGLSARSDSLQDDHGNPDPGGACARKGSERSDDATRPGARSGDGHDHGCCCRMDPGRASLLGSPPILEFMRDRAGRNCSLADR